MPKFHSTLIPGHRYRNAPAAIGWLSKVFGFERHAIYEGEKRQHCPCQIDSGRN